MIAGWTGRDVAAIEHHIEELAALGVPRPSSVPLYYRVATQLLTQADSIEVLGEHSSGEAEPVLLFANGEWWLSVGSDHTDREVESYGVAVSKQMCAKPVASTAWRWSDVAAHQDEIALRSRIFEDGAWIDYQCGTLGAIPNARGLAIRPAAQMEIELHDPRLARRIVHRYAIRSLPVIA